MHEDNPSIVKPHNCMYTLLRELFSARRLSEHPNLSNHPTECPTWRDCKATAGALKESFCRDSC